MWVMRVWWSRELRIQRFLGGALRGTDIPPPPEELGEALRGTDIPPPEELGGALRGTDIPPPPEERGADIDGAERVGAVATDPVRAGVLTRPVLPAEFVCVGTPALLNADRGFTIGVARKVVVTAPFCLTSEERCDIPRMLPRGMPNPAELFSIRMRSIGTMGREIGRGPITMVVRFGVPAAGIAAGGIGLRKLIGAPTMGTNPKPFMHPPGSHPHPND